MDKTPQLLQISAKLYQHLQQMPADDKRDDFIVTLNTLLDERGQLIAELSASGFQVDTTNKSHQMLVELDKGIKSRLEQAMNVVKADLRNIQKAKKNEKQYVDPYSKVAVMDGRYYDKKN